MEKEYKDNLNKLIKENEELEKIYKQRQRIIKGKNMYEICEKYKACEKLYKEILHKVKFVKPALNYYKKPDWSYVLQPE